MTTQSHPLLEAYERAIGKLQTASPARADWDVYQGAVDRARNALVAALLDAARTEGRGEGEPVAWMITLADGNRQFQSAEKTTQGQPKRWAEMGFKPMPLYASPIREPEISREALIAALDAKLAEVGGAFLSNDQAADAILNLAPVGGWKPTHRHVKRGSDYQTLKPAILQTEAPLSDGAALLVYRDEAGAWWARTPEEFNDGRFEPLPPPPQEQEEGSSQSQPCADGALPVLTEMPPVLWIYEQAQSLSSDKDSDSIGALAWNLQVAFRRWTDGAAREGTRVAAPVEREGSRDEQNPSLNEESQTNGS